MFKLRRKLIPLLLTLFIFNSTYAQSEKIDLSVKNESLRQLIKQIETKTDYTFMLDQTVDQSQKVSVDARQESLDAILKKAFAGKQISYEVVGKQIILKISRNSQSNQSRKISGTVKDQNGEPVIGANVSVKGTTVGTITDIDGNFMLEAPTDVVIQISYIGYVTQEISLGNKDRLNVLLKEDLQALDEIVIIGYGTAKRKDFTGSVSSVKLENSPISLATNTNALESLKGNVTGLDIGATNSAGGTPTMQIRGQNSISGSNDPLVVVDGVIFMGSINDINPNDIASYDVLKDATSAAAYGSRSANGVIIITTKKGKQGKPVIHFNARGSMQSWHLKPELMNGEQWLDATAAANGYSDYSFLVPQEEINMNSGKEIDWLDEISRTGWTQDYQAAVSGAGDRMNYYLSASYTESGGVIKGDDYERVSILGKIDTDITSWLQIGLDAAYTRTDYSGIGANIWSATILSPYAMMYRPNGMLEAIPDGTRGRGNPLWGIDDESKKENVDLRDNLRANAYAVVKCPWISGLSYRFNYAGNLNYRKNGDFTHESYNVPAGSYDDDSRYSVATQNSYLSSAGGSIANERTTSYVIDNILNYNQTFGKHNIDLTAVATRDYQKFESQTLSGSDFAANGNTALGLNGLHYASTQKISLNNWKRTNIGYFGRASYSFGDTYYMTASYRRDGSSVFGANNKWGNFWAIGTAWRMTNEPFVKSVEFLDDMKLKLSWGKNGNQGLTQYSTLSQVVTGHSGGIYYPFGNSGKPSYGINQNTIGNSNLGWETTEAWNMGFESTWLNSRLFVDVDVYLSKTYDQIFSRSIPVMTGFGSMYSSMGEVKNRGVEATVRTVNIQNKEFNWTTGLTFWLNRNKLVHLYGEDLDGDGKEDDDIGNSLFIGESIHSIFGYEQDGIVQTNDTEYMEANGVSAGTPKYVDKNNDGVINEKDRSVIGNKAPNFKLNLSNTLQYKNWELYVMIAGVFGGNGYYQAGNTNAYITGGDRQWFASNGLYIPYWTEANPSNKYPAATFTGDSYFLGLQNRAYVRLQDVTLSYTFNQPWVKNMGINNFKLFITGKNLATITGWDGGDPETGSTALSQTYPIMTNVSFGLNLSF
ncbi:TonB-dependent receptor [Parabacteroides faecis]|nr:TonB-dependent receptor [Parabacteroides faecis]RHR98356.1 SusC/RagA family TonB-linked outer membrane protein [Parabacteroides sp. AF14-59]GGJ91365.1 SusC/RagA family TonB-linked outer membrane protein [Parabacteroides faecis]